MTLKYFKLSEFDCPFEEGSGSKMNYTFLEKLDKVSKEEVEAAAKKYFNVRNARIIVVGKGSDILTNLENVQFKGKKLPVLAYSKTADRIETPDYNAAIPTVENQN